MYPPPWALLMLSSETRAVLFSFDTSSLYELLLIVLTANCVDERSLPSGSRCKTG